MCLKNEEKVEAEAEAEETTKHSSNFYGSERRRGGKNNDANANIKTKLVKHMLFENVSSIGAAECMEKARMTWWISEKYRVVCRPYVCRSGGSFSSM